MEDRLQKFAVLVDAETFTKAAERLHMSQPALTLAIQKLEHEMRLELLTWQGNQFRVTSAGRLAYIEGKELLVRRENLKQQIANLKHEKAPLSIGMIDSVAEALFMTKDALNALEKVAEISLSINNSAALRQAVEQSQLDIAVIAKPPQGIARNLKVTNVGAEPLVFVAHPAMATDTQISLRAGKLSNFIGYNQASTTFRLIKDALARHGIALEPNFYSTSPEVILKLVLEQKGVAALPQLLVRDYIVANLLIPVFIGDDCQVQRTIIAVKPRTRVLPRPVDDVLERVAETLRTLNDETATYQP